MKKVKILLLVVFMCLLISGCASLKKAVSDITPAQATQMQAQIASTAGPYIPAPYQIPATALLGWLACVGYNWFKGKTKPKV